MTLMTPPTLLDLQRSLPSLLGVHRWTLNFQTDLLRLEFGRQLETARSFDVPIAQLFAKLTLEERKVTVAHWERGVQDGQAGPERLPFLLEDGTRVPVESACGLYRGPSSRLLVGVFRRLAKPAAGEILAQKAEENARKMVEFIESFIANAPSCTLVVDGDGGIMTANRECLRFLGKSQASDIARKGFVEFMASFNPGLGDIARNVMRSALASRGRYELVQRSGIRQTLYWRGFPFNMDPVGAPIKVFSFDLNQNGPRPI
jgi:PAS domain-containing protein